MGQRWESILLKKRIVEVEKILARFDTRERERDERAGGSCAEED